MKTKKVTASDRLQQQLEKLLLKRQYLPGDRLPSEREVMKKFKVGRGAVRAGDWHLQFYELELNLHTDDKHNNLSF